MASVRRKCVAPARTALFCFKAPKDRGASVGVGGSKAVDCANLPVVERVGFQPAQYLAGTRPGGDPGAAFIIVGCVDAILVGNCTRADGP